MKQCSSDPREGAVPWGGAPAEKEQSPQPTEPSLPALDRARGTSTSRLLDVFLVLNKILHSGAYGTGAMKPTPCLFHSPG